MRHKFKFCNGFQLNISNLSLSVFVIGFSKKQGYTRGGTTSQNNNAEDENWFVWPGGEKVSIVPKPLVREAADKAGAEAGAIGQEGDKPGEESKDQSKFIFSKDF